MQWDCHVNLKWNNVTCKSVAPNLRCTSSISYLDWNWDGNFFRILHLKWPSLSKAQIQYNMTPKVRKLLFWSSESLALQLTAHYLLHIWFGHSKEVIWITSLVRVNSGEILCLTLCELCDPLAQRKCTFSVCISGVIWTKTSCKCWELWHILYNDNAKMKSPQCALVNNLF